MAHLVGENVSQQVSGALWIESHEVSDAVDQDRHARPLRCERIRVGKRHIAYLLPICCTEDDHNITVERRFGTAARARCSRPPDHANTDIGVDPGHNCPRTHEWDIQSTVRDGWDEYVNRRSTGSQIGRRRDHQQAYTELHSDLGWGLPALADP